MLFRSLRLCDMGISNILSSALLWPYPAWIMLRCLVGMAVFHPSMLPFIHPSLLPCLLLSFLPSLLSFLDFFPSFLATFLLYLLLSFLSCFLPSFLDFFPCFLSFLPSYISFFLSLSPISYPAEKKTTKRIKRYTYEMRSTVPLTAMHDFHHGRICEKFSQ